MCDDMQVLSDTVNLHTIAHRTAGMDHSSCTNPKIGKLLPTYFGSPKISKKNKNLIDQHIEQCIQCEEGLAQARRAIEECDTRMERNSQRYADAEKYLHYQRAREDLELRLDEDYLRAKEAGEW